MSIEELLQRASQGDASAQYDLSFLYEAGEEVEQDLEKAFMYLQQAADAGYEDAYARGVLMHLEHRDYGGLSKAFEFTQLAREATNEKVKEFGNIYTFLFIQIRDAMNGDDEAFNILLENRDNAPKQLKQDIDLAISAYGEKAYNTFNEMLRQDEPTYQDAEVYLEKAIKAEYGPALAIRGLHYEDGFGVEQNDAKAVEFLERALQADSGLGHKVKSTLAMHYFFGTGTIENKAKATQLFEEAANQGSVVAMSFLGMCYSSGDGVVQDQRKAVYWLEKAVNSGEDTSPAVKRILGLSYLNGEGTAKNVVKAESLLREAADSGDFDALKVCALNYRNGEHFTRDFPKSDKYIDMMLAQNDPLSHFMAAICYASCAASATEGKFTLIDSVIQSEWEKAERHMEMATRSSDPGVVSKAREMLQSIQHDKAVFDQQLQSKQYTSSNSSTSGSSSNGSSGGKSGGCYVATAVYGSYDCPQVWVLRRFRDNSLARSVSGRLFIKLYYAISPKLVEAFGSTKPFNLFFRKKLDAFVDKLKKKGYDDSPYKDKC